MCVCVSECECECECVCVALGYFEILGETQRISENSEAERKKIRSVQRVTVCAEAQRRVILVIVIFPVWRESHLSCVCVCACACA